MADEKKNAYGGGSSDTSFRRTWDRAEWAEKAKERESSERTEAKARYEAKAAGKKYYGPTPDDAEMISARRERINFEENLNKTTLVPAGAGVGKRGRSAGFYCEACDLTFKDSLQWVDHLNSKQHLNATGRTGEVLKASLEEVLQRLEWLKARKREEEKGEGLDLKERLRIRAEEEEKVRAEKREKRKELRKRKRAAIVKKEVDEEIKRAASGPAVEEVEEDDEDAIAMARMMGFSGSFGTTKKKN
ncbi:hypothetical protein EDC01DRAFT_721685 [Geopyxis carbonaria]|nr:hypothetical protein EDC01DRAFT_721685 [Geopyxis carbonaria]